ncbi:uncharacterized protein BT62DRAFT_1081354 [Guyanagaster necrorhizus]|uniref:Uncharacterized protein n=1 Tax=Guyanagaster necrorhizus TaxID=856835 RepID=A0A9P7VFI3_9AGAR|nr:uncharacterized protein BT62DRAFT_1081354 [Guyanagaster necrorhizus MCA 3950]KAG7439764.1 hypothetical protein BT62DRAFT_1081354 [Guyanagaster necrorhizus MCA 3950]
MSLRLIGRNGSNYHPSWRIFCDDYKPKCICSVCGVWCCLALQQPFDVESGRYAVEEVPGSIPGQAPIQFLKLLHTLTEGRGPNPDEYVQ